MRLKTYKGVSVSYSLVPMEGATLNFWLSECGITCDKYSMKHRDELFLLKSNIYKEVRDAGPYVTGIAFMGGYPHTETLNIIKFVRDRFPWYKVALFTSSRHISMDWKVLLGYQKVGETRESQGGLDQSTTNQKFLMKKNGLWEDHTWEFRTY